MKVNQYTVSLSILTLERMATSALEILARPDTTRLHTGQIVKTKNLSANINSDGYFALECIYNLSPFYNITKVGYDKKELNIVITSPMFNSDVNIVIESIIKNNNKIRKDEYTTLNTIIKQVNDYLTGYLVVNFIKLADEEKDRIRNEIKKCIEFYKPIIRVFKDNKISDNINFRIREIIKTQQLFISNLDKILEGDLDEEVKRLIKEFEVQTKEDK